MNHFNIQKKEEKILSVNQEIYKQIRKKMDSIMIEYNEKQSSKQM